jgi:hypothetical protein
VTSAAPPPTPDFSHLARRPSERLAIVEHILNTSGLQETDYLEWKTGYDLSANPALRTAQTRMLNAERMIASATERSRESAGPRINAADLRSTRSASAGWTPPTSPKHWRRPPPPGRRKESLAWPPNLSLVRCSASDAADVAPLLTEADRLSVEAGCVIGAPATRRRRSLALTAPLALASAGTSLCMFPPGAGCIIDADYGGIQRD